MNEERLYIHTYTSRRHTSYCLILTITQDVNISHCTTTKVLRLDPIADIVYLKLVHACNTSRQRFCWP